MRRRRSSATRRWTGRYVLHVIFSSSFVLISFDLCGVQTKSTLVADIVRLIDPLPINLPHLHALLSRRAKLGRWFHKAPRTPEEATLWTNQELSALLDSQVPRAIGQMPSRLGLFECIAPSPLSSKIEAIVSRK
jgi:hypothetical protein